MSIWGFPDDPFLTPMLSHRLHLSPSPLCRVRQAEGGVCSHWFPHTPCCQDTERSRRADSYTGTLQDDCLATDPRTNAIPQIIECSVKKQMRSHGKRHKRTLGANTREGMCMPQYTFLLYNWFKPPSFGVQRVQRATNGYARLMCRECRRSSLYASTLDKMS